MDHPVPSIGNSYERSPAYGSGLWLDLAGYILKIGTSRSSVTLAAP
jgi:hypothetical protein